jgi:hypothetical protein
MAEFDLPHFGKLELSSLAYDYDAFVDFKDDSIRIDLNFDISEVKITNDLMEKLKSNILDLENRDLVNMSILKNDFDNENGEIVRSYLEHHLDDFDEDELEEIIDTADTETEPIIQLYRKLKLYRVGYYLNSSDMEIIYDYTIGKDFTDYIVVIKTDLDGNLIYITEES